MQLVDNEVIIIAYIGHYGYIIANPKYVRHFMFVIVQIGVQSKTNPLKAAVSIWSGIYFIQVRICPRPKSIEGIEVQAWLFFTQLAPKGQVMGYKLPKISPASINATVVVIDVASEAPLQDGRHDVGKIQFSQVISFSAIQQIKKW